ncbi:MAG: YncE family protein [Acidobacteriaceae bacterium]|nr:YncE family protein [Acidobacteriaceae bacterium]
MRRVLGAVLILLFTVLSAVAADSGQFLLVLSKGDRTLAIVDPSALKVLGKVPVGEDPHEVIASRDGKFAYVSNYGSGAYHTLAVIDLISQKALTPVDLGPLRGPHGLAFEGGIVWFTAEAAKAIGRYDPATKTVDWILGTGQNRTHMIRVSRDMTHIYTTNVNSATVSIIEKTAQTNPGPPPGAPPLGPGPGPARRPMTPPGGDWNETVVHVGRGSEGFDLRPDAKELWVANAQDGTVSIIDLSTAQVSETLQANVPGANRIKFTPDGKLAFISSLGNAGITVLDAASHKELKRFPTPGAAGIEMQPDGSRVYVACTGGNYVAVIDPNNLEIVGRIDAGPQPDGMAWCIRQQ